MSENSTFVNKLTIINSIELKYFINMHVNFNIDPFKIFKRKVVK